MNWAELHAGSTRETYRRVLLELARADERIVCVDSDTGGLADTFGAELPLRYINVGIAEAHLLSLSAGLASTGLIPFANTMSAFATARAAEQLRNDVAAAGLSVRIVGSHGGLSAGHYGPTHHAPADLAVLRTMPNLTVLVPADTVETAYAVRASVQLPGPVFIRLGRSPTPLVYREPYPFTVGRAVELAAGNEVTLIATGPLPVGLALAARTSLSRQGISARVLNMHTISPLDEAAVLRAARETAGIVTVEDHLVAGGLGGAVCEAVCAAAPCPVARMGAATAHMDQVGDESELLALAGITEERIVQAAVRLVSPENRRADQRS
ncbi:transketolase family protein [Streptomyces sp. NPDC052396]|uniref:transketolase family protein n=1 Tax=Streptomyces sp. NPDC052396 TaxID=3365689 RepID=UPI0037CE5031